MLLRLTFIFSVLFSSPAWAEFKNGNDLHRDCAHKDDYIEGVCLGYVIAIADVLASNPLYGFSACIPSNATAGQLMDVVRQWLNNNPQERHYTANSIVALALSDAFPCN